RSRHANREPALRPFGNPVHEEAKMAATKFNASALPPQGEAMANMIVSKFADAGFGQNQQLAALANAIAESALDPAARANPPDDSVGLFQISRRALGSGHTVQELE